MNDFIIRRKINFKFFLCFLFLINSLSTYSQNKWLNFTNSNKVRDIVFQGDYVWAATSGGLLKLNLKTDEKYLFNRSNSEIPSNNVSCLCIDTSNNLWIGTYDEGVSRFDGKEWKTFNDNPFIMKSNKILSLLADRRGIIWIGTEMGLYRFYDGFIHNDWNVQGIIQEIIEDNNSAIWIGTTGGMLKIYEGKFETLGQLPKPHLMINVSSLSEGRDNKIWIATRDGLMAYEQNHYEQINLTNIDFPYGIVTSVAVDSENNLWIGSPYGRVAKYNGYNFEIFNSKNSELSGAQINEIKVDGSGSIWICTDNGLYRYGNSNAWEFINTSTSILNLNQNTEIFSDPYQNIWLSDGQDLYSFNKENIKQYNRNNSGFKGAYSLVNDENGKIWIGHSEGLTSFDGKIWINIDTLETLIFNREKEIFEIYKDTAWVEKNYKQYLLDSNSIFKAKSFVTNLTLDKSCNLWFRTSDEFVKYDGLNWTLYDTTNSNISSTSISSIACDDNNNLWIGTYKNGLMKFDGNEWIIYDSTNLLKDNRINSIDIFKDSVFVSTRKGLMLFSGENWSEIYLGESQQEFYITKIIKKSGNYWMGTNSGLIKYLGNGINWFGNSNSGLANNYIKSICLDYYGNLWILTIGGLNIFNEEGIINEKNIINFFYGKGTY